MRDPGDCGSQIRGLDKKGERPPLLKKSKTISSDDGRSTPHFPGPLLPAVRRVSTLPPPSSSDLNADVPTTTVNHIDFTKLSDRDWMFPSFLGPHAASRVKHRGGGRRAGIASSKKEKQLIDPQAQRFDTNEVESNSVPTPAPTVQSRSTPLTLPLSSNRSKWRRYYSPTLVSFPLVGFPVYDFLFS